MDDIKEAATVQRKMHLLNGVDLNPYSTSGMRHLWQLGYDGHALSPDAYAVGSYGWRAWRTGQVAKILELEV